MLKQPDIDWQAIQHQIDDANEKIAQSLRDFGAAYARWAQEP